MRFWHFLQMYGKVFAIGYKTLENFMSTLEDYIIFSLSQYSWQSNNWRYTWYQKLPFSSVQLLSQAGLPATPWTVESQASLSITNAWSLLKLMFNALVMPFNHLILCCPFFLPPSIFPSIRDFSSKSALCIRWPKYWSFSFSISLSNEFSGLISFRIDWFDLIVVQGPLKSLLQHHNSKASVLQCSAFFIVQLSHPCMITGKTIALTRWTCVGRTMSLFFKEHLLISWLQSPSAMILEPKKT